MSYATPNDIMARYDVRRLGDLVRDDKTQATPAQLLTDANLQAALDDAAGRIDSAVLKGGRYLPSDLTTLPTTGSSWKLLLRLNCDLAYGYLLARRDLAPTKRVEDSETVLAGLAQGELVFPDVAAAVAAGKPVNVSLSSNITLLSSIERVFGQPLVDPSTQFQP